MWYGMDPGVIIGIFNKENKDYILFSQKANLGNVAKLYFINYISFLHHFSGKSLSSIGES